MKRATLALAFSLVTLAAPAAFAQDEHAPDDQEKHGIAFEMDAGPAFRRFYDISLYGADGTLAVGGARGNVAFYGTVSGFVGRTANGLSAWEIRPGFKFDLWSGRVHGGLGLDESFLTIGRATSPGDSMAALGVGLTAEASYDVWRSRDAAAILGARLQGRMYFTDDETPPIFWGPELFVGFRL